MSFSVIPFSLNTSFPPLSGLPLVSVTLALSVMVSPMYVVCLVTVTLLGSLFTSMLCVVLVGWYVLDPVYVTVILFCPLAMFTGIVMVPVGPVWVFISSPFGSVILIGALVMVWPVVLSFTVMFSCVFPIVLLFVVIVIVARRFSMFTSFSVVWLGV